MDNYDVIIERTVRDLFKSSPLTQIKKFKMNKEKEIEKKDEDLRNLILEKYPSLVRSISSLELIDHSLNELQNVRANFLEQVKQIEKVLVKSNEIDFEKLLCLEEPSNLKNEINNSPSFEDSLEECWNMLYCDKDLLEVLLKVISLERKFNKESESIDFLLSQLMENAMKNFVNFNLREDVDYEKFIFIFFGVYLFISDEDNLLLSEFYLKLKNDVNINQTFTDVFIIKKKENPETIIEAKGYKSIQLLFKLLMLKLSNYLNLLSVNSNEIKLIENLINLYMLSSFVINLICNTSNNTTNQDSLSSDEDIEDFESTNKKNNKTSKNSLNLLKTFEKCKIIFSIESFEILYELEENVTAKFTEFIKQEISRNFKLNEKNPINLINLWTKIFTNKGKNYDTNHTKEDSFVSYLFLDISIKQIDECLQKFLKGYDVKNYYTKNNSLIIDLILTTDRLLRDDDQFSKKVLQVFDNNFQSFLTTVERDNNPSYLNYIITIFHNKSVVKILQNFKFENCIKISRQLAKLFVNNVFKEVEEYSLTLENFLSIENFSEESCYLNKNDSNTHTIYEVLNWLSEKFKLEDLDFDFEDYSYEKIKFEILENITKTYLRVIKSLGVHNKRIAEDLKVFLYIFEQIKHQDSSNELYSSLIQELDDLLHQIKVNRDVEHNNVGCFIKYFIPNCETNIMINDIKQSLKLNFNKTQLRDSDLISFHPKLNIYMLKKLTVQKNQSNSNTVNTNTTSKLLELRIDDNYVSTKPNIVKTENIPGKDSKISVPKNNKDVSISQPNLTDYLGYFGGKLKENLSNITGLINTP